MAFKTTIKVALLTGAAKDDTFTTEETDLSEDMLSAFLNVLANDPGSATLYSLQQDLTGIDQMTAVTTAFSQLLGATITIQADGTIFYDASNIESTLNQLAEGEFATDTFVYTVRMSNGALSTAVVTLEIAGINDTAVIYGDDDDRVYEDGVFQFREGTLSIKDPDTGEDSFVLASGLNGTYGDFTFDTESGFWTYTLRNNDPLVQALARDEYAYDTLAVTSKDESASRDIIIEINGRNDVPTLEPIQAINILDTDADDTPLPKNGTLTGEDVDNNASLTYSLTDGVTSGTGAETKETEYGTLTLFTESGAYSFLADPDKIDSLVQGRTEVVNFTVTVTDEHNFSASQTLTFNLFGANETAVITGEATGEITEGNLFVVV